MVFTDACMVEICDNNGVALFWGPLPLKVLERV